MDILHVAAEIAALGECLGTLRATEWPQASVLSEVVSEIAALLEDTVAALVLTFEE